MSVVTIEESPMYVENIISNVVARSRVADVPLATSKMLDYVQHSSQIFIGRVDGVIACMWGIIRPSILSGEGYIWLLTTDLAEEHKFLLIRHSQLHIKRLLTSYSILIGDCAIEDVRAHKWLKFLGAKFDFPVGHTVPFRIEKH